MPPYPYNLRDFSYSEEEKSAGNFSLEALCQDIEYFPYPPELNCAIGPAERPIF